MARIVVADDDADIRDLISFKLQQDGHEVIAVGDGAAAVETCRREVPDLAVLDVTMPGMGGLDVVRALRLDPSLAEVPVILLTAHTRKSDIERGLTAGADDYLAKPFSPRELASRVAALLQRTRT
jgi:two-component system, OmpR family, response regulator MtrA